MKTTFAIIGLMTAPLVSANVYTDALQTLSSAPETIKAVTDSAPNSYTFNSRFTRSSSVAYTGQTFRQLLMQDIKGAMTAQPRGSYPGTVAEAKNMLMSYYNYDENTALSGIGVIDGFTDFKVTAVLTDGSPMQIAEGTWYSDIQSPGSSLRAKLAGIDNSLRRGKLFGWQGFNTPEELLMSWFDGFAENAVNGKAFTVPNGSLAPQAVNAAITTPEAIDYAQLTQKFLYGAISFSQAARDYLSTDLGPTKGLNADNTQPAKPGVAYTAMEHHWDEGFGYFGAARDLLSYNDKDVFFKGSIDTDGDGFISLKSEKNLAQGINASRLDVTAADQDLDLSGDIMKAFLKGRALISQAPADYKKYVEAYAQVALTGWEKTFAGITIHYINKTISEYGAYGSEKYLFTNFAKFWGEMKGFALAFQFNPKALMSDADFDKLHSLMGDKPVLPHAASADVEAYVAKLKQARELLGRTYNFSDNNVLNW